MKNLFFLLLLFFHQNLFGQNLVPNPSFENIDSSFIVAGQIWKAPPWVSPNSKTPDLYHSFVGTACADSSPYVCVPENLRGYQIPNTGDGYAGIYAGSILESREYLAVELLNALEPGAAYIMSYRISLADASNETIDRIGVHFSATPTLGEALFDAVPQIISPLGAFIINKTGWTLMRDTLIASGEERYITIGNFTPELDVNTILVPDGSRAAYYYIDDVKLIPISEEIQIQGDTSICIYDSTILTANNGINYIWLDSWNREDTLSREAFISVAPTITTTYIVYSGSCSQSITVNVHDSLKVNLGNDTTLCIGEPLMLAVDASNSIYRWQDNSVNSTFNVEEEGLYWVEARNTCGTLSDTLLVGFKPCLCPIYFPNVFSPNNDGVNDTFAPFFDCTFDDYKLSVFTRWGEKVFETEDLFSSWDGTFNTLEAPLGVYVYLLQFSSKETTRTIETGAFSLIR